MGTEGGAGEKAGKNGGDDGGVDLWGVFETKENECGIESEALS